MWPGNGNSRCARPIQANGTTLQWKKLPDINRDGCIHRYRHERIAERISAWKIGPRGTNQEKWEQNKDVLADLIINIKDYSPNLKEEQS